MPQTMPDLDKSNAKFDYNIVDLIRKNRFF